MRHHEQSSTGRTASAGSVLAGIANLLIGLVYVLASLAAIAILALAIAGALASGGTPGKVASLMLAIQILGGLFWTGSGLSLLAAGASLLGADARRARERSLRAFHRALTGTLMPQCIFLFWAVVSLFADQGGALLGIVERGFLFQLAIQLAGLVWPLIQCLLVRGAIFPGEERPRTRPAMSRPVAFRPDLRAVLSR